MSSLESRIRNMERTVGVNKQEPVWLVVVHDGDVCSQASEAAVERAKAQYKLSHPEWKERDFNVIYVASEESKALTERLIAGEVR